MLLFYFKVLPIVPLFLQLIPLRTVYYPVEKFRFLLMITTKIRFLPIITAKIRFLIITNQQRYQSVPFAIRVARNQLSFFHLVRFENAKNRRVSILLMNIKQSILLNNSMDQKIFETKLSKKQKKVRKTKKNSRKICIILLIGLNSTVHLCIFQRMLTCATILQAEML